MKNTPTESFFAQEELPQIPKQQVIFNEKVDPRIIDGVYPSSIKGVDKIRLTSQKREDGSTVVSVQMYVEEPKTNKGLTLYANGDILTFGGSKDQTFLKNTLGVSMQDIKEEVYKIIDQLLPDSIENGEEFLYWSVDYDLIEKGEDDEPGKRGEIIGGE